MAEATLLTREPAVAPSPPTRRVSIDEVGLTARGEPAGQGFQPREFLHAWFQLFRTARIHAITNQALQPIIERFARLSSSILARDGALSFQAKDGSLFLNSVKLRLSSIEYCEAAEPTFEFFESLGMGGFRIDGTLTFEQVKELLEVIVYAPPTERNFAAIERNLRARGLPFHINKCLGVKKSAADVTLERRSYAFLSYSKLVVLYRSLLAVDPADVAKRQFLNKKLARTIECLVDICREDDHTFLGITTVKQGDSYLARHAANVAVLAIALGEKLGLGKVALADLGMAALFADVGLKDVPAVLLDREDRLEAREREVLERHPLFGVRYLLGQERYTRSVLNRILVAFEHHRGAGGGGYPAAARSPGLWSRIVAIADTYDALTTDRPWRKALLPDEALGKMLADPDRRFDPRLLKVFVNTLGLYPVGTLVRLTTGELGVVTYGAGEGERMTRPVVALLDERGRPSRSVDLTEKDGRGGYRRSIVSSVDPAAFGLQPSGLIASSPARAEVR